MCRTCSLSLDNNFGSCCCKPLHLKLFPDTRNAKKFSFGVLILVRSLTLTEVVETRVDLATVQRSYYKSFWSLLLYLSLELCPSGQREEKGTDTFTSFDNVHLLPRLLGPDSGTYKRVVSSLTLMQNSLFLVSPSDFPISGKRRLTIPVRWSLPSVSTSSRLSCFLLMVFIPRWYKNDVKRKISNLTLSTILNCFERSHYWKPISIETKVIIDWFLIKNDS